MSDDNPFSEAQFKTLKYHPGFPGRFDLTAAIAFCRSFFPWYNTEHRHAGIAMLTPDDVHHHRAHSVLEQRERTLQAAWTRHPERFVRPTTRPPSPSGLDQPTRDNHNRRNCSVNRYRQCLKVVDRFGPTIGADELMQGERHGVQRNVHARRRGDPTRDGNRTMLFSGEIAEQRQLECVRAARAQGDWIGQHIATLELLRETSEDVQEARAAGLEKLRPEIERASIAIAQSGVGRTTVEETLDETVAQLETMRQRAGLYASDERSRDATERGAPSLAQRKK